VLFAATQPATGSALWKSDGTGGGTQMVKDLSDATAGSGPILLTAFKNKLYFRAYVPDTGSTGGEVYYSDGTEAGTGLLVDLNPGLAGSEPINFKAWGDYLYFSATNGTTGHELWRTDGTAAGTTLVADINPGAGDSSPYELTPAGSYLYFGATVTATNKEELWRTDGTAAGTIKLTTITAGTGASTMDLFGADPAGNVYFMATNSSNATTMWKSDGTVAGTVVYNSTLSSVGTTLNVDGTIYFAGTASTTGSELYRLDPGAPAPVLVKDIFAGSSSSTPQNLTYLDGTIYFNATNGTNGRELWKTDGTTAGTVMIKDVNPGSGNGASAGSGSLVATNGLVYFRGDDGVHGVELWRSDGTAAGTYMVKDITPTGATSGNATRLFALNGYVYFAADDGVDGVEAWRSDGTTAGTAMLADLYPENSLIFVPSNARFFTAIGNDVYYVYDDGNHGDELWKADQPDFATMGAGGALTISATGGDDAVSLVASGAGLTVTLNGMSTTFAPGAVSSIEFAGHGGNDTLDLAGGTITFANDIGADTPNLALWIGAGTGAVFDSTQHIASLQINGGSASISAGGAKVLVLNDLSITGGSLDLNDNDLILRDGVVGTWNGSTYDGISGLIRSGSIISSAIQSHSTALGVAGAGSILGIAGSQGGTFDGETVSPGDVLVKFTYVGDANLDGKVNIDDYGRIDSNVGQSGVVFGWYNGDFNFDGKINIDDYGLIDSVIGAQGPVL
jgi:ELWxxDGT repeat protein